MSALEEIEQYWRPSVERYDLQRMAQEILGMDAGAFNRAWWSWRRADWDIADPRIGYAVRLNHEIAGRDAKVRAERNELVEYTQMFLDDFLSGKDQRRIFGRMLIADGLIEADYGDSKDGPPTSWQLVSLTDEDGNVYTDIREQST